MNRLKVIILILLAVCVTTASAKSKKKKEEKKQEAPKEIVVNNMYAFGVATSLKDSIIYLTDVQQLPMVKVAPKTKFLERRADLSRQLKSYFNAQGSAHMTCAIVYDQNRKKLEKKYKKIYDKAHKNGESFIKFVTLSDFTFEKVEE